MTKAGKSKNCVNVILNRFLKSEAKVYGDSYPANSAQHVKIGSSHVSFFVVTLEEDTEA